jgi:hypothetical protein
VLTAPSKPSRPSTAGRMCYASGSRPRRPSWPQPAPTGPGRHSGGPAAPGGLPPAVASAAAWRGSGLRGEVHLAAATAVVLAIGMLSQRVP